MGRRGRGASGRRGVGTHVRAVPEKVMSTSSPGRLCCYQATTLVAMEMMYIKVCFHKS